MRKLKFRVWEKDATINDVFYFELPVVLPCRERTLIFRPTDIIEMYTGYKDKNGKEIYEGDIVIVCDFDNLVAPVEFRDGMFLVGDCILYEYYCEIIGNIYENKELLE